MADRRSPTLAELERALRSAGDYVHPTDDLRPRTLEAASERTLRKRGRRRALGLAAALLLAPVLGTAAMSSGKARPSGILSASDLHARAQQISQRGSIDTGWGLFEAFLAMRREQAAQFAKPKFDAERDAN